MIKKIARKLNDILDELSVDRKSKIAVEYATKRELDLALRAVVRVLSVLGESKCVHCNCGSIARRALHGSTSLSVDDKTVH